MDSAAPMTPPPNHSQPMAGRSKSPAQPASMGHMLTTKPMIFFIWLPLGLFTVGTKPFRNTVQFSVNGLQFEVKHGLQGVDTFHYDGVANHIGVHADLGGAPGTPEQYGHRGPQQADKYTKGFCVTVQPTPPA